MTSPPPLTGVRVLEFGGLAPGKHQSLEAISLLI